VVGELAGRLIDHAAVLDPLGELPIKGKRHPVHAYRLLELTPVAPAFETRLDAPLVGRKRELAALRKSLKRVVESGSTHFALVAGPPGVGKSRLAAELTRRAKGVRALWGRCLSYGDGITYWPLREIVRDAPPSEERDAVLAALEAETPPPAPEIAFIVRQLCEALAREKPLVLVFDDVHWAEPTFLELLELVADRGEGAILVVCLARDELLDERPEFLEGRRNVDRIALDALSAEETDALLDGLGGSVLESDQRSRIVEAAEGNPFFLEQLLAVGLEGGLAERALPATVQGLLAARLDRLGPGERAVLERGAVIGKEFRADDVIDLLEPAAAPTVPTHLEALSSRGFVRPAEDDVFRFRHVLVQEAAYRSAPKRLRAELHERFADRLDETARELPELDEFVGYHLEQAYRLRTELGETDRKTERLSEDAGRRIGVAGMRAWRRGDAPATMNLLGRATTLLPADDSWRLELLCELGLAERSAGDADAAETTLSLALEGATTARDARVQLRAQLEASFVRLLDAPEGAAEKLLESATGAIPTFERLGDHRALGRAWLLLGWVRGGIHCQYAAWEEAAEKALEHYRLAGSPASTCLGQIAGSLYWGPTPVAVALDRCNDLLIQQDVDLDGRAHVLAYQGGLEAQLGRYESGRLSVMEARRIYDDLGRSEVAAILCGGIAADVELAAGEYAVAEEGLKIICDFFRSTRNRSDLATRAADLAEVLYCQGKLDEAETWTDVSRTSAASDYVSAQVSWRPVQAKILAQRGAVDTAQDLAREAIELAKSSDGLNRLAKAHRDLGEVLRLAGRGEDATKAFADALRLYELKGNVAESARTRAMRKELALV
jgi:tetratricopeptide (TPR) repeat protein